MRRVLAAGLACLALSGCGVLRDGAVRPSVNDCVAAIPVAKSVVGAKASLVKLRRVSLPAVQHLLAQIGGAPLTPPAGTPGATPSPTGTPSPGASAAAAMPRPCVLVFSGSFTSEGLVSAPSLSGAPAGGFAVLVTTTRHPRVLRTVITATDPVR